MAELLNERLFERPDHDDHVRSYVGHVATSGGDVCYLREGKASNPDLYVNVGGLISGCAYGVPACEVASASEGISSVMIRHGNKRFSGNVLEVDALEVAETLNTIALGKRVHIVGHSKGTKVALLAVPNLDTSIEVASVIEVNPVLGTGVTRANLLNKLRRSPRVLFGAATTMLPGTHISRSMSDSSRKEAYMRAPAIAKETIELLLRGKSIKREDVERVRERKGLHMPRILIIAGSNDWLTPVADIEQAMQEEKIVPDRSILFDKPGTNDHFAFLLNSAVMRRIVREEASLLRNSRRSAAEQMGDLTYLPSAGN